jgi:hypothetical protein
LAKILSPIHILRWNTTFKWHHKATKHSWYKNWHDYKYSHHVHVATATFAFALMLLSALLNIAPVRTGQILAAAGSWSQTTFNGTSDGTYTNTKAANTNADISLKNTLPSLPANTVDNGNGTWTTTLQPDATAGEDTRLNAYNPTTNLATEASIFVGYLTSGDQYPGLIRFTGVNTIPAGSVISSAQMDLYETGLAPTGTGTVYVQKVLKNWVENQATWNIYATGSSWATVGCLGAADRNATSSATFSINTSINHWHNIPTNANLVADVQSWVDGTTNNGWKLYISQTNLYDGFASSDNATPSLRPKLTVTYTPGSGTQYVSSGTYTSAAIAPTGLYGNWGTLNYTTTTNGQTITVDVLNGANNNVLATNVATGTNLILSTATYPSLKLRANLSTADPNQSPLLNDWSVGYTTDVLPPTAPTGLIIGPQSGSSIPLSWTAATDADSGVAGYQVSRAAESSPGSGTPGTFARVGATSGCYTTAATSCSDNDPALQPNTKYFYQVKAIDNMGLWTNSGEETADSNTLALWHFDEGSGGSAADSSGNGATLTPVGTNWSGGKFDAGQSLNGTSSKYAYINDYAALHTQTPTVEAWVNLTSNVSQTIVADSIRGAYGDGRGFSLSTTASGKLGFQVGNASGTWKSVTGSTTLPTGSWIHIAGSYDGTNLRVFLNGNQDGINNIGTVTISYADAGSGGPNPSAFYIGVSHNNNNSAPNFAADLVAPLNGIIDEVRVSNVARDGAGLLAYYNEANPYPQSVTTLTNPPTDPIAAAASTSQINLSWTAPAGGANHYHVYSSSDGYATPIYNSTGTSTSQSSLAANTQYTYRFYGVNADGAESATYASAAKYTLAADPNVTANKSTSTWYNVTGVTFTNAAGFGNGGVTKYRYTWDQTATHVWTGGEADWTAGTLDQIMNNGSNYLHLKAYNGEDVAGNTLDLGPYRYDGEGPTGTISINEGSYTSLGTVNLTLTADDNGGSGVASMQFSDDGAVWGSPEAFSGSKTYTLPASDGLKTVYVRFIDNSSNAGSSANDTIFYDHVAPANPTGVVGRSATGESVPNLTSSNYYNHPNPRFDWSGVIDPAPSSGVKGYYVYFGTNAAAEPKTATNAGNLAYTDNVDSNFYSGSTYTVASGLSSGTTYYLKVRAADNALNDAPAIYAENANEFIYRFDSDPSSLPAYATVNPPGPTATDDYDFDWPDATDNPVSGASGVASFEYKRDNGTDSWTKTGNGGADTFVNGINKYKSGTNLLMIKVVDNAGNDTESIARILTVPYFFSDPGALVPTNLHAILDQSQGQTINRFKFDWDNVDGAVKYYISVNSAPTEQSDFVTASETSYGAFAKTNGVNTFYVVAEDAGGNANWLSPAQTSFSVNTVAPDVPDNIKITDASDRGTSNWALTVSWTALTGQPVDFSGYEVWRCTAACDNEANFNDRRGTVSTNIFSEAGLTTGTDYYYRVKSRDTIGHTSAFSEAVHRIPTGKFTTPPTYTSGPRVDTKALSATITWTTNRAASSAVFVGTGPSTCPTGSSVGNPTPVTAHTVDLTGLTPGTTYRYKIQSLDNDRDYNGGDGDACSENEYTFTTLSAPGISDVQISEIRLTSAIISWKTTSSSTSKILYGKTTAYGATYSDTSSSQTTTHTVKLDNLSDSTTYHLKIQGTDIDGNALQSDDYVFTTLTFPKLFNLKVAQVPNTPTSTVNVTFDSNVPTSSLVTVSGKGGKDVAKYDLETLHAIKVTGLLDNTAYTFTVKGRDQYGNEALSISESYKTDFDTRPPLITDITVETSIIGYGVDAKGQIVVSWTTDEPSASQIEYGAGVTGDYSSKTQEDTSLTINHVVIISDLKPSSPYHFRVVSADGSGNTGKSADNSVLTEQASESVIDLIIKSLQSSIGWIFNVFAKD